MDREINVGDSSGAVPEAELVKIASESVAADPQPEANKAPARNKALPKVPAKRARPVQPLRRVAQAWDEPVHEEKRPTPVGDRVPKPSAAPPRGSDAPRAPSAAILLIDYPGQPNKRGATTAAIQYTDGKKIYMIKCPKCAKEIEPTIGHFFHAECKTSMNFTVIRELIADERPVAPGPPPAVKVSGPRPIPRPKAAPKPVQEGVAINLPGLQKM
jgi:hypothetical protein